MRIRTAVILLLINLFTAEGQVADTAKYVSLDPYYFHLQYLKEHPAIMIDVRLPFEYRGKIIRDAINIPSSREMRNLTDTITKDHALFLYCTDGYRSRRAAELLYDQGFRKLYNLEGGIVAWKKEKMPVAKGRGGEGEKRRRGGKAGGRAGLAGRAGRASPGLRDITRETLRLSADFHLRLSARTFFFCYYFFSPIKMD